MTRTPLFLLLSAALLAPSAVCRADDGPQADAPGDTPDIDAADHDAELQERLSHDYTPSVSVHEGRVSMCYSLTNPVEIDDFHVKGFDLVDMHLDPGLTLGAGSRGTGFLQHPLEIEGDFCFELEVQVTHNTPSAVLALVLNKKVSVLWGQQVVKTRSFRPYDRRSRAPDVTLFREERVVGFKVTRKGDLLTVECGGRKVAEHRFEKGELKTVQFGLLARNIRFVVSSLSIEGQAKQ